MITIIDDKVAVIPVFDSNETKGGLIKHAVSIPKRRKQYFHIIDAEQGKILDEAEDIDRARELVDRYTIRGYLALYKKAYITEEDQVYDSGERCDQGVVKYIGPNVKDVKIGDYVFFSGYTGTLIHIEGEGQLIVLRESFIECSFDVDQFYTVPGLYFKDREGNYFEATYEQAMNIIAASATDLNLTVEVKPSEPKYEDYNVK